MVKIFEKTLVLEQYWVQFTELHLLRKALFYWEDEKVKLESQVQWDEFIRIMKDFEQKSTKDLSNPPSTDPRTPIALTLVSPTPTDLPSIDT